MATNKLSTVASENTSLGTGKISLSTGDFRILSEQMHCKQHHLSGQSVQLPASLCPYYFSLARHGTQWHQWQFCAPMRPTWRQETTKQNCSQQQVTLSLSTIFFKHKWCSQSPWLYKTCRWREKSLSAVTNRNLATFVFILPILRKLDEEFLLSESLSPSIQSHCHWRNLTEF